MDRYSMRAMLVALVMLALAAPGLGTTLSVADTAVAVGSQAVAAADSAAPSVTEMVMPSIGRIVLSLGIIILVIYATVFLLRKLSGGKVSGGRGKTIQVIEQTYLAPKKSVCLVKMADRAVLIGVTDTTISLLTELDWDALPHETASKANPPQAGFQGVLAESLGKLFTGKGRRGV